ncbi:MAG: metal ABC transporter permease, partial [Actinomycetota bacterium]|nr:metal ABC transporter permease [Actinomycetota bacterium]
MPALVSDPEPGVGDGTGRRRASRTGLAALVVVLIAVFYKELLFLTFDEASARAAGLPAGAVNTLLST